MKIIITTSNKYHHLVRIFIYLFQKNWDKDQQVEIVGYDKPKFDLPSNFTFHSMGEQIGGPSNFTTDLRKYFEKQDDYFIWMFDDTFIKGIDFTKLEYVKCFIHNSFEGTIGRFNLAREAHKHDHIILGERGTVNLLENTQTANYRLSTQPSIWNRNFLLKYMTPGLTPWKFETQLSINDGWRILGLDVAVVKHNEGVTKHDIYAYDLTGIEEEQIKEMKELGLI